MSRFSALQVDAYKRAWLAIDNDRSGVITVKEIMAYMRRNNYDDSFLSQFLRTFDNDGSGRVTLREFCSVLGLDFRTFYGSSSSSPSPSSYSSINMSTDDYVRMWLEMDVDRSNSLSMDELIDYMRKRGFKGNFISEWIKMFDTDTSGNITLDEFCSKLGLSISLFSGGRSLPSGVRFVTGDMDAAWQIKLAELCLEGLRVNTNKMSEMPRWIKKAADERYGLLWHVVVVNGEYWCYYGHEPGYSFVFQYGKYFFIVWKTPMM